MIGPKKKFWGVRILNHNQNGWTFNNTMERTHHQGLFEEKCFSFIYAQKLCNFMTKACGNFYTLKQFDEKDKF